MVERQRSKQMTTFLALFMLLPLDMIFSENTGTFILAI